MQDPKKSPKIAIWAPSHNFVWLYLRNQGMYRQSEKNLLNSNISSACPHDMANFGPLVAEIRWRVWGTPTNFNGFRVLAALVHNTSGRQPNFAALNRGRHLYAAGRPSRWALAHILVSRVALFIVCCERINYVITALYDSDNKNILILPLLLFSVYIA